MQGEGGGRVPDVRGGRCGGWMHGFQDRRCQGACVCVSVCVCCRGGAVGVLRAGEA